MADVDIEIITEISGLDELEDALTNGAPQAAKRFLQAVHKEAAGVLKDALEENAPYQTGELAGEIGTQTITNSDGMTTRVGPSRTAFWGLIQEFGAPEANVPALHWAENAAKSVQDDVLSVYYGKAEDLLKEMSPK